MVGVDVAGIGIFVPVGVAVAGTDVFVLVGVEVAGIGVSVGRAVGSGVFVLVGLAAGVGVLVGKPATEMFVGVIVGGGEDGDRTIAADVAVGVMVGRDEDGDVDGTTAIDVGVTDEEGGGILFKEINEISTTKKDIIAKVIAVIDCVVT